MSEFTKILQLCKLTTFSEICLNVNGCAPESSIPHPVDCVAAGEHALQQSVEHGGATGISPTLKPSIGVVSITLTSATLKSFPLKSGLIVIKFTLNIKPPTSRLDDPPRN